MRRRTSRRPHRPSTSPPPSRPSLLPPSPPSKVDLRQPFLPWLANGSAGLVPVGEATAQDLRTKIIEVKGPARVRAAGDPLPPQTFWCEMHTGAQVELGAAAGATRGELQGMSKEQLIDALLASQQSLKTYKEKVARLQQALS
mmetsp:Transcript_11028/g.37464  ORF Transcript_11028/g.37464 Transcript_11028/m.37464 type:complete len:143 (-) Transcript_11028:673-1101(-)